MDRESWTEDESIEWMEYNVVCQDKAIFKMCPTTVEPIAAEPDDDKGECFNCGAVTSSWVQRGGWLQFACHACEPDAAASRCCTVCGVAPDDYQDEHDQYCEQCEKPICDDHFVLHTWGTCETCYCLNCSK